MPIQYQETTSDLLTRIDIHNKYGERDIDQWMLETLWVKPHSHILDVGCGAGKQCFTFYNYLDGLCKITGGDVNVELLAQARLENAKIGNPITFTELNFNRRFPFDDEQFHLVSCCFAIYYARRFSYTIREMYRLIRPGGRLFTTGPMPENKKLFYDVIREATHNKPIPRMPGSSRYGSKILEAIKAAFPRVDVHIFENPLTFHEVEPFLAYTRASLNEDRKIWGSFFDEKDTFESVMNRIGDVAARRLAKDGELVMTKVVGGFVGHKAHKE